MQLALIHVASVVCGVHLGQPCGSGAVAGGIIAAALLERDDPRGREAAVIVTQQDPKPYSFTRMAWHEMTADTGNELEAFCSSILRMFQYETLLRDNCRQRQMFNKLRPELMSRSRLRYS